MKRRNFWYLLFALFFLASACTEKDSGITTFILIRHAEKGDDGTRDPDLKAEGNERVNNQRTGPFTIHEKVRSAAGFELEL
ncbi:MAG: hypothetical protein WD824_19200 [Cyclobacteriaceae bacterium]